ncbi:hypothetical protein M8J76_006616 [Diaphorina citri]|nr:hypothetical protein M8J75_010075 [Diaphorina citri]KAI5733012.1 hypothetical protein M8J76_006616 [Diaphorina citri]
MKLLVLTLSLISFVSRCSALLCYQCVSTQPGCGTPFKWLWYPSISCPEEDDISEEIITRDCLSTVKAFRTDIPADRYEGCRAAAKDPKLANYVNHSIPELDVQRNFYDSVTWCFCYFDHWCNAASSQSISMFTLLSSTLLFLYCWSK